MQTRPFIWRWLYHSLAGAKRENPAEDIHHLTDTCRPHIGTKILGLILLNPPYDFNSREVLRRINFDIRIMLVVLKENIVLRSVLLNQVTLKNQRLKVVVTQDDIKVINTGNHGPHLHRMVPRLMEVLAYPILEVNGFPDIDDFPLGLHEIASGTCGKL